ncbi:MAG: twin-arginine translocation signal domain-containing protein, partial [Verrucomicrobiia bacterium]
MGQHCVTSFDGAIINHEAELSFMKPEHATTRRQFVKTATAAALAASIPPLNVRSQSDSSADTSKIVNYNPDMEYRRCGKTGWMVSAIGLGGALEAHQQQHR